MPSDMPFTVGSDGGRSKGRRRRPEAGRPREREEDRGGRFLLAFVQLRCSLGGCLLKTTGTADCPEIMEIHKVSGDRCTLLKVRAASPAHLEGLIERVGEQGEIRSHIVLSTAFDERPVEPDRGVP